LAQRLTQAVEAMIAKELETILGTEFGLGEAEMVQRFQSLRNMRLLPNSRGRNAEHIHPDMIVSGLLSVVDPRPGMAGVTTGSLRGLLPVGGASNAFAGAESFSQALQVILNNEDILRTVIEIRVTSDETYTNATGHAVIIFSCDEDEYAHETCYVPPTAKSLLQPGMEENYDRRTLNRSIIREVVIFPCIMERIANNIRNIEVTQYPSQHTIYPD
jgi:hypothetical protein